MNLKKSKIVKNSINLTNFLPILVTNFLKKGEKEKTFVKVNKVLRRLKKTCILNDSFFINKRLFINKIFFYPYKKNQVFNQNNFNFFKKTREYQDFLIKKRIFFFCSNLYFDDFLEFERYNKNLSIMIMEQRKLLKQKKIKIKILLKKIIIQLFFSFYKSNKVLNVKKLAQKLSIIKYLNFFFYDLKYMIYILFKRILLIKKIYFKKMFLVKISDFIIKKKIQNFLKLSFLNKFSLKKKKKLLTIKNNKKLIKFKKYYYLSKKIKLLQKEQNKLNNKYVSLRKINKKMNRFEFKKRKILYKKLMKAYRKSKSDFFKFKRKIFSIKNKKLEKNKNAFRYIKNFGYNFGLKLSIIKKLVNKKKNSKERKKFFKYSIFPVLFSPVKFLNVILSKYRLYFTFKEQRMWSKQQIIPKILNLKRDIRITARNFKKSLLDVKFENLNFQISFYESLLYAGAKKGFLLKIKHQAYIFMLKNAIFLQFMLRRRKNSFRRKRRKKIDRK